METPILTPAKQHYSRNAPPYFARPGRAGGGNAKSVICLCVSRTFPPKNATSSSGTGGWRGRITPTWSNAMIRHTVVGGH